jgi:hypothetical protein
MKAAASTRFIFPVAVTTSTVPSLPAIGAGAKPAYRVSPPRPDIDLWTRALSCPLPRKKNYQLLKTLRDDILAYLVWVTDELAQGDMGQASAEIERAAERLRNIAMLMPAARASATSDDLEETITPVWRK